MSKALTVFSKKSKMALEQFDTSHNAQWIPSIVDLARQLKTNNIVSYGYDKPLLEQNLGFAIKQYTPTELDDLVNNSEIKADILTCLNVLQYVTPKALPTILNKLQQKVASLIFLTIQTEESEHENYKSLHWWREQLIPYFFCLECGYRQKQIYFLMRAKPQQEQVARVFIGTEPRMHIAEKVLRQSIEQNCSIPVEITSMDYTKGGVWAGWDMGRPIGQPARLTQETRHDLSIWFTDFTNFRWAIPEMCEFKGRAIYMDVDIVVRSDIAELINLPLEKAILSLTPYETSVMLFDCQQFEHLENWPRIAEMKKNRWALQKYLELLVKNNYFGNLPAQWNCLDGEGYNPQTTRLVHYTNMKTQPWRPYPDEIDYRAHAVEAMERLWYDMAKRARLAGCFLTDKS